MVRLRQFIICFSYERNCSCYLTFVPRVFTITNSKKEQAFASEECCGPALATLQQQEEIVPEGNEPPCYLCFQPDIYPTKPGVLVVARYLGAFTCAEFFNRGLNGQVSQGMCGPLQDHALTACGCAEALSSETQADEPNPGNQGGSRPPPPTAAPVAPPTRAPVVPPSPAPVLPPTLAPVEMVAAVTPAPVAPITLSQPTDAPRRHTDAPMSQVSLTAAPVVALVASPAPVEANIPAVPAPTDAPVVDATSDTEESKPSKGDKKPEDDGDGEHAQKMSKKDGKGSERRQQRHKNRHRRQLRRSSN